jgi:hypothetical protein
MRGLPFSARVKEVLAFFKDIPSLDSERIYFAYDGTGRPSGEAYIILNSAEDFQAAMRLHENKMGSRYIELFASSTSDMHRVAKQRKLRVAKGNGTRMIVSSKEVLCATSKPTVVARPMIPRGAIMIHLLTLVLDALHLFDIALSSAACQPH